MLSFNWSRWLRSFFSRPRTRPFRRRGRSSLGLEAFGRGLRFRPEAESLEDRVLMAVIPAPAVSNQAIITTTAGITMSGYSPNVAQDPSNPLRLVEVHAGITAT